MPQNFKVFEKKSRIADDGYPAYFYSFSNERNDPHERNMRTACPV
jgi:hypothetical protein